MSREHLLKSTRRIRIILLGLLIALLGLFVVLMVQSDFPPYKMFQYSFIKYPGSPAPSVFGIRTVVPCTGEAERCTTCHLGGDRLDLRGKKIALPFRAHGPGIANHDPTQLGCVICHGGEGRALDPTIAHLAPAFSEKDPRMKAPHVEASCAQCHVPGAKKGQERLLEGAKLYAGLGCPVCHPLTENGTGGLDFGPDLRTAGRRSISQLKTSLIDPAADFEGSTMPSFNLALDKDPKTFESLIVYLESLPLPRQFACAAKTDRIAPDSPCTDCHAGPTGQASGRMKHRCPYIIERKDDLRCGPCHEQGVPNAESECPVLQKHRDGCPVCHK